MKNLQTIRAMRAKIKELVSENEKLVNKVLTIQNKLDEYNKIIELLNSIREEGLIDEDNIYSDDDVDTFEPFEEDSNNDDVDTFEPFEEDNNNTDDIVEDDDSIENNGYTINKEVLDEVLKEAGIEIDNSDASINGEEEKDVELDIKIELLKKVKKDIGEDKSCEIEGKIADVLKAYFKEKNTSERVATNTLRSEYSSISKQLTRKSLSTVKKILEIGDNFKIDRDYSKTIFEALQDINNILEDTKDISKTLEKEIKYDPKREFLLSFSDVNIKMVDEWEKAGDIDRKIYEKLSKEFTRVHNEEPLTSYIVEEIKLDLCETYKEKRETILLGLKTEVREAYVEQYIDVVDNEEREDKNRTIMIEYLINTRIAKSEEEVAKIKGMGIDKLKEAFVKAFSSDLNSAYTNQRETIIKNNKVHELYMKHSFKYGDKTLNYLYSFDIFRNKLMELMEFDNDIKKLIISKS